MQVADEPVAVRPRVRAEHARRRDRPARPARRQPQMPPESTTSGCSTSTPPRRTRSRASCAPRTISPAAMRMPVSAPQRAVALDVVAAQRLLEPVHAQALQLARAARRGGDVPAAARGRPPCASPGWRRPSARSRRRRRRAPCSTTAMSVAPVGVVEAQLERAHAAHRAARRARRARSSGVDQLAARGIGRQALVAAAEQAPAPGCPAAGPRGPRSRTRRSTAGRRGSRPSRRSRARPPCAADRGPRGTAPAPRGRAGGRRSRSPDARVRVDEHERGVLLRARDRDPTRPGTAGRAGSGTGASRPR